MDKIQPFKYWVQKTLPAVYDDSLSYYQLLAKIVHHLNTIGNAQNEVVDKFRNTQKEITDELRNTQKEVAEKVKELMKWFDNLDVHDEINEKLDKMAEDGTLDQIINHNIFNTMNKTLTKEVFNAKAVHHGMTKPTMTIIDDDGQVYFYNLLKGIIERTKAPIVSALITNRVNQSPFMSIEQINELKSMGVEFVDHTHNSPRLTDLTEEEMRTEFEKSQAWLKQHGLTHDILVYPYGANNTLVRRVTREYYKCAFYVDGGVNTSPIPTYRIKRQALSPNMSLDEMKSMVDNCKETNGWLVWMLHIFDEGWNEQTVSKIEELINYARSQDVDILNATDGLNRFGNVVDVGDLGSNTQTLNNISIIGADGEAYGATIGSSKFILASELEDINSIHGDMSEFIGNRTTKIAFSTSQAIQVGNLPENRAGILEIMKTNSNYRYQTYHVYQSNKKYHRFYADGWTEWQLLNPVEYLGLNAVSSSTPPTDNLLVNKITLTNIQQANAIGFPKNKAGTLITNALDNNFIYQEYKIYQEKQRYVRNWVGGKWSTWQLIGAIDIKPINTVKSDTPITEFDEGITITHMNDANAIGFPDNRAGILTTYNLGGGAWPYQEYKKYNSWDKYIRYWDGSAWSAWKQFSLV